MEEYDVLGNFKDLENIFKNIPTTATLQPSCPELGDTFDNSLLLEFESNLSKKKKKKASVNTDTIKSEASEVKSNIAPKTKEPVAVDTALTTQNQGVAYRTRRSLRSSGDSQNSYTESTPANESNKGVKGGKKSTRGRGRKSNDNTTLHTAASGSSDRAGTSTGGNNVRKSTRGRARKNKKNAPLASNAPNLLDTIEIEDAEPLPSVRQNLSEPRDITRARRNIIAERAARCTTVDVVDLVTSPMIRVEGFIDVDADDTEISTTKTLAAGQPALELSFDEDNPEMTIRVNWECKPEMFKLRKYQKFAAIFEQLAKRENKTVDQIFLNLNSQIIKPNDTPATINYKIYQFIDGRAMSSVPGTVAMPKKKRDPNIIKLKVQSDKFKKPLNIEFNKTENFRKLVIMCAEELKVPYENIVKLCFDGETLENHQTPVDLELEGGEIIEIHLKE